MANQILLGRALDANGYIAPGAKATIYADGTSTLITVYSDVAGTVVAANPIVADGDGFWPQRYVTEDAKAAVTTSADVALYTLDPAPTSQGTGASASQVSFAPTVPLPQTNVQAAIEAAAALAVSGFAAFGLGITGNATLLANLDATGTGAGLYRFDGTTTGTYPTGVAAGDTGLIELWRQAGATAMQVLYHATSDRVFHRRMATSVWGAWRENIEVNTGATEGDTIYRSSTAWTRLAKGAAGQILAMNSGATAPEWTAVGFTCRAWAQFNGIPVAGTYSRTGTLVTVTLTAHGMTTGQGVSLDFTTGTATDGFYTATVVDANTFTVTDAASGSTSGNVTRRVWVRGNGNVSSITRANGGEYTLTFTSAMSDANYTVNVCGNVDGTFSANGRNDFYTGYPISTTQCAALVWEFTNAAADAAFVSVLVFR